MAADGARPVERTGQVHVDDVLPLRIGHLLDHCRTDDARVVHQPVHRPEAGHAIGHGAVGQRRIRHAALDRQHASLGLLRRDRLQRVAIEVDRNGVAAERDDRLDDRLANALPRAGDDDGAAFEGNDGVHSILLV
ncbi:hypothetical protein FQZ97_1040940 [compost metagenome]